MTPREVRIREVGPRDGLQNAGQAMASDAKKAWISALAAAGFQDIEVGSFVPRHVIAAMADTAEQVAHALAIDGLRVTVLAPNARGMERALASGAHKVNFPVSASEAHSLANVRMTPGQMVGEVALSVKAADAVASARRPMVEATLSTAFGCTLQGDVPEAQVVRLCVDLAEAGVDCLSLADTVGYANPKQVRRLIGLVRKEVGGRLEAVHLHNTRGLGLANALAAYEEGIRSFDSAMAGLGGCPFAPGASGNTVTEDLVYLFESMGVRTGIDFERLLQSRRLLEQALPGEPLYGHLAMAGLPKNFTG
jgi:hydroxymethylglutaryl-CoA lyase